MKKTYLSPTVNVTEMDMESLMDATSTQGLTTTNDVVYGETEGWSLSAKRNNFVFNDDDFNDEDY